MWFVVIFARLFSHVVTTDWIVGDIFPITSGRRLTDASVDTDKYSSQLNDANVSS